MKVSVITINLNNAEGLDKTIKSVLSQSFIDYEFIVIDGGSDDNSKDIIKQYSDKITYWVSEPDKGLYNAMNKGIIKAKGDYCYFLNSGDYFVHNNVLQQIFETDTDAAFICGNFMLDRKGELVKCADYKNRDWKFSLYDLFSGFLAHQAFFINKEMFTKYGLYDETLRIMSDWKLFFVAIGINNEKVFYKDVDISDYDTEGISSRIGGKIIYEEKVKIAKEELSPEVFQKLDRLYFLERNGFIPDFILSKKWIHFLFKVFFKFCKLLRLS